MAFIPRKTTNDEKVVRSILMNGDAIRIDGRDCTDVVDYSSRKYVSNFGNIGDCFGRDKEFENFSADAFRKVIKELKEEGYSVKKVSCSGSGCCQYHTIAYYLEEE